jgi:hypothetical protein
VEAAYDDVTLSIHRNSWTDAEALRAYLQTLYANEGITGAILVGLLPYAMWEFPWGERCPLPFFFEDMDGTFSDTDGNGVYDYHGWGANDGPEIWIALMRPPENDVNALQGFLDKSHRVHSGALSVRPWAFVCINNDWRGAVDPIRAALTPLYGSNIDVVGGSTWRVSGQEYLSGLGNGYEITSLWAHSASWVHQFDQDPQQYVYYYDVTDLSPGSFFTAVWGCHAMDFNESPSTNFGIAYTFGASNGVAAVGATRSIGIENQEVIYSSLAAGKNLSEAYFDYLEYNYDSAFIQRTFPSDDTNKFVWDFVLYGDPFVFNPDVVAPMNLLRNDALTRIDPPSTPLSHIFTDACSSDPSVSLDSADPADCGSAINGEGGMVSSPGSGDNDDLYVSNFALPGSDPESNLLDDVTRPLMFWQLEHATPPNALRIIKTPAARTIGIDIR